VRFTKHSLDKISLLRLSKVEVMEAISNSNLVREDQHKSSKIYISRIRAERVKEELVYDLKGHRAFERARKRAWFRG